MAFKELYRIRRYLLRDGLRLKLVLLDMEEYRLLNGWSRDKKKGSTRFDRIYTCGPKPMMMAVARYASSESIACEVSLENTMACGIGACLCCVEKLKDEHHVCVCTEGPVFNIEKLSWLN